LPLVLAPIALLARHSSRMQRATSALACAGIVVAAALLLRENLHGAIPSLKIGGYPAPFGVSFVADTLSSLMALVNGTLGLAVSIYGEDEPHVPRLRDPLLLVMVAGVSGAFLTGDLFNFYVWVEVMVVASFGLLVL